MKLRNREVPVVAVLLMVVVLALAAVRSVTASTIFVGHYGYFLSVPTGYQVAPGFASEESDIEIVVIYGDGVSEKDFADEPRYHELELLRIEVAPKTEGMTLAGFRDVIAAYLTAEDETFTIADREFEYPAFQINTTAPYPLVQVVVDTGPYFFQFVTGSDSELLEKVLESFVPPGTSADAVPPPPTPATPERHASILRQTQEHQEPIERFVQAAAAGEVEAMIEMVDPAERERVGDAAIREMFLRETIPFFVGFSELDTYKAANPAMLPDGRIGLIHFTYFVASDGSKRPFTISLLGEDEEIHVINVTVGECIRDRHPVSEGRCAAPLPAADYTAPDAIGRIAFNRPELPRFHGAPEATVISKGITHEFRFEGTRGDAAVLVSTRIRDDLPGDRVLDRLQSQLRPMATRYGDHRIAIDIVNHGQEQILQVVVFNSLYNAYFPYAATVGPDRPTVETIAVSHMWVSSGRLLEVAVFLVGRGGESDEAFLARAVRTCAEWRDSVRVQ